MTKLQLGYERFIKMDVLHEREQDANHDLQIYQGKSVGLHFGQYKMQNADCRLHGLQIGFKMQTKYKMQSADCMLGLKCRPRPKLSHRLIRDIFSRYDLYIGNKKVK